MGTLLGMNTMDIQEFTIPVASFDLQLLPPEAREIGSTAFQDAVIRYFVNKYLGGNKTAIVTVDDENIQVVAFPASVRDPMNLALGMLNNGKIKEALPLLESLARQRKDDAELFYNLGIAYSELGEYQNAVMRLKRCVDIDPRHANAFVGLGVAYQRLGQSQLAITNSSKRWRWHRTTATRFATLAPSWRQVVTMPAPCRISGRHVRRSRPIRLRSTDWLNAWKPSAARWRSKNPINSIFRSSSAFRALSSIASHARHARNGRTRRSARPVSLVFALM